MITRVDGQETRRKILETACRVFGEKGYRDATHAEICRLAEVNTAAINYHFGSKAGLYRATWDYVLQEVNRLIPSDGGVSPEAPAPERLRGRIRAFMQRAMDSRLGDFHRIRLKEMANPTDLLDETFAKWLRAHRKETLAILRDLLGAKATRKDLELCELSIIGQCHMVQKKSHSTHYKPFEKFTSRDVDCLVEHITQFSLAGIEAVHRRIKKRKG